MPDFDKWWDDPQKHAKRRYHWLPHLKRKAAEVGDARSLRYFTLCARTMIDVFMLLREGLLKQDPKSHAISSVYFCECDPEPFAEIQDLVAREDAGFFGYLEKLVLFADDDFTKDYPTLDKIAIKLEDERLTQEQVDRLQLKRTHFSVRASFPYDYVNLDFCEYYYPRPPDMLQINDTVEKVLDWQRTPSEGDGITLNDFILAVTCRHDEGFPQEAEERLTALIQQNCASSETYRKAVEKRALTVGDWSRRDREDFFFAGWPKDIARAGKQYGWNMEIVDYVYYRRQDSGGTNYVITCLVARFSRAPKPDYEAAALYALDQERRTVIEEIERTSSLGEKLMNDLGHIVDVRNVQARRRRRQELPRPRGEVRSPRKPQRS